MGFFSDLKEDLSQAVNELVPEEKLSGEAAADGSAQSADSIDLSSMLDQLEEPGISDEPLEEEIITSDGEQDVTAKITDDMSWMTEELGGGAADGDLFAGETQEPEWEGLTDAAEDAETFTGETVSEDTVTEAEIPAADVSEPDAAETSEEPAAETLTAMDTEAETMENDITEESSREEEKRMDEQTQVQEQENRVAVDETAVVTEGMTITGDIVSHGSMELIGTVNGNLDIYGKLNITGTIQGDSKAAEIFAEGAKITGEVHSGGSVKIGQSSVVIGNISASSAVIAGAVKGDIDVHGPVILDTTAIVMGNIKSKSVQINNGAVIEGMCSQCYADVNPTSFFEEFKKKKA